jgi:hypothetical protein
MNSRFREANAYYHTLLFKNYAGKIVFKICDLSIFLCIFNVLILKFEISQAPYTLFKITHLDMKIKKYSKFADSNCKIKKN